MGAGWEIYPAGYLVFGVAVLVLLGLIFACLNHIAKRVDEIANREGPVEITQSVEPEPERQAFGRLTPEEARASRAARRAQQEKS